MLRKSRILFPLDGFLTLGRGKYDVDIASNLPNLEIEEHGFVLTKAEELNTMISGEDESSSVLHGRLRPRKSTTNIPNSPNKPTHKTENKVVQDKPKRNSILSKASPNKQDDLTSKAESSPLAQFLCPHCDKKFTTKLSVSKHARRIHLSTSKQNNFFNCLFCNHTEAAPSEIIRHMVDSHPNQYFACLDCNTRFFSTSELAEHKLNVCEKQKQAYRNKLRQKTSSVSKKDENKIRTEDTQYSRGNKEMKHEPEFNGLVISCELKPTNAHDAIDIEDNITTNLILPSNIGNTVLEKNAVIILDDIQWNRRIPPNFSFRNADADQILSRLGVVHRSPRVGESTRREWLKMIDVTSQKFEKCFDTNFYSRVASNVQQNLARFLDGSFNFSPDPDKVIKTRKSKSSAIINTAEGFPILLPHEQYSRNRFDGYMPRALAPKHKWKWDSTENEKNIIFDASVIKRDNHVDNCIITLVSSLDIWTQLRMRSRFEGIFCKAATEKFEKQNIIGKELKEILESREIPCSSSQMVEYPHTSSSADAPSAALKDATEFPSFLGLSPRVSSGEGSVQPAVLSGEWVRPRCYVCCACGDQTRDARALSAHMASHHPNAQVQHYEIVGESLLNADILKHLYVPPSQMSNRTRPIRGFRDCTKCKKSVTMEDLHQHMLDCAGDTPTVRRKCRSRPFGVRRRRPRLPDNTLRKKMRKDLRTRHNAKALLRTRPRIRTEVGDAETIRKMIADLPAKRHRQAVGNLNTQLILRPRRKLEKQRNKLKIKRLTLKDTKTRKNETKNDIDDSSILDEDDQPLKPKTKVDLKTKSTKKRVSNRVPASKCNKISVPDKDIPTLNEEQQTASNNAANTFHHQQISSENSSQRLNIHSRKSDTREEGNHDGTDNNDNGGKTPDRERDKDNDKGLDSDPTPLKHSINSITSTSSNVLQSEQKTSLPEKLNESEKIRDSQNIFLENDTGLSLPEKPPIQSNLKRSSQKKRESLLNCIEKIKSQQKGETMYDPRRHELMNRWSVNHSLSDPHPAVISRSCDESGTAKNVVPTRPTAMHNVIGDLFQSNTEPYSWISGIGPTRHPNDKLMLAPIVNPLFHKLPEAEFAPQKTKSLSGRQKRKSSSSRLAQNEQANQFVMPQMYYQMQLNPTIPPPPYLSMVQPQLAPMVQAQLAPMIQAQLDPMVQAQLAPMVQAQLAQRMPAPDLLLQQHQANEVLKNELLQNPSFMLPWPGYISDLHYEGRMDQIPSHNETATQRTPNILPQSFQSLNTAVPRINQSMAISDISTIHRKSTHKRASESSESDVNINKNLDDADFLNNAYLRRASPYDHPPNQGNRDSTHNYRSQVPFHDGFNKNTNILDSSPQAVSTQDEQRRKKNRSFEIPSAHSDSADFYLPSQSQTSAVYDQYYKARLGEEQPKSSFGKDCDGSQNEKNMQGRYIVDNPYRHKSVATENLVAEKTHKMPIQKSIVLRENIDNKVSQRPNSYIEVAGHLKTPERQTESVSSEQPLDLSGKHAPAVFDYKKSNIGIENDESPYVTSHLSKATKKYFKNISADVYSKVKVCEQMADNNLTEDDNVSSSFTNRNLSFKDTYGNMQHHVSFLDQSSVIDKTMLHSKTPYYRKTKNIESAQTNDSSHTLNVLDSFSNQLSHEKAFRNVNSHSESTGDRFEKYMSTLKIPNLLAPSEATAVNIMQSKDFSNHGNTGSVLTVNLNIPENVEQNVSPHELNRTQTHLQSEDPNEFMLRQNETLDDISVEVSDGNDNSNIDESPTPTIENDPETANKFAKIPQELVDLLNGFTREQHNKFFKVMTLFTSENQKGKNPVDAQQTPIQHAEAVTSNTMPSCDSSTNTEYRLTINTDQKGKEPIDAQQTPIQHAEAVTSNTMPSCVSSTNTKNRLTINTAVLPSSSILPKKRHSPSAMIRSQDYSNSLLRPSHVAPSIYSKPNEEAKNYESPRNESVNDAKNIEKKICDDNVCEATPLIKKIIDFTDEQQLISFGAKFNDLPYPESVYKMQSTSKNSTEKPSVLRSVRIKPPMPKLSMSDDKQLTIPKEIYSQQSISFDSKQRNINSALILPHPESVHGKNAFVSAAVDNSEYHSNPVINQTIKPSIEAPSHITSKPTECISTYNDDQREQSAASSYESDVLAEKVNKKKLQKLGVSDLHLTKTYNHQDLNNEDSTNILLNNSNSINEQDAVVSKSSKFMASEQNHNSLENVEPFITEQAHIHCSYSQVEEILENNKNNVTEISSETNVNNHADISEESDDDISLAVIVKQKNQEQPFFSGYEDSSSDSDKSNLTIEEENKSNIRSKRASKHSNEIQLQNNDNIINSVTNTVHEEDFLDEAEIDSINDAKIEENEARSSINKLKDTFGNNLLVNAETTPIFKEYNETQNTDAGDGLFSSRLYLNENVDDSHNCLSKRSSEEEIDRKRAWNDSNSTIENKVTTTETQPLSQTKAVSQVENSKIIETSLMGDSNMAKTTETTERALRRSKRGKSLFSDLKQVNTKKIPVAKKQLILSSLLDENTHVKTKITISKRKITPEKTKNKKNKLISVSDCGFSDINVLSGSDENDKQPIENELTNLIDCSSSGGVGFDRKFDVDANYSIVNTKKRKSNILLPFDDISKDRKTNNNENASMTHDNIHVSSNDSMKTSESGQVKSNEHRNDFQIATPACSIKTQPEKTVTEIRTACYNRPIPRQQMNLTCIFDKNPENYDPYDIDLDIDMVDMSRPVLKRKSNKSVLGKKIKKFSGYENSTNNVEQKFETEMHKTALADTSPPRVSDSDSSISDVPLQKYVEEKAKLKVESHKTSCNNRTENNNGSNYSLTEDQTDLSKLSCQGVRQNNIEKCFDEIDESELKIKSSATLPISMSAAEKTSGALRRNEDNFENNIDQTVPTAKQSNSNTQKKNRRRTVSKKSPDVSNEYNQQLIADMSMDTHGILTYKTPRKSNLLASKKITETFNKLQSDEDDYRPLSKNRHKKSSQSEKKSAVREHTSKSATQDSVENFDKKSSVIQSIAPQEPGNSRALDEPRVSIDGEIDLVTAQKMLESEEIRKLERDLYSGFKKAAQANVGKTSGFNQLRVEETSQSQNYDQYVSTPLEDDVGIENIHSPERLESSKRLESPERSDSPESLKDKPLMYPEEEVNIYEDKYDIIKRRREASANAKQFQKVDKPTQCKTSRGKKKSEKKTIKKSLKKKIQQASQVPTKAALKNFESIKISIPTQDLHMPSNVSPPHRQKRSRPIKYKQPLGKTRNDSASSYKSDSDTNSKVVVSPDIYEFQDDERPVSKGYKVTRTIENYKSSSSDNEDITIKVNRLQKEKQNRKRNAAAITANNDQKIEKFKRKKGRGKRKGKFNVTNKKAEIPCEQETVIQKEKQKQYESDGSNAEQRMDYESTEEDDVVSNDKSTELQVRFVPDNNDESSYESDASPPSPLEPLVEDSSECTCPFEIDTEYREKKSKNLEKAYEDRQKTTVDLEKYTEGRKIMKGCYSKKCRHKNTKSTALEIIYRSFMKAEDKEDKLNGLFDALLREDMKTNVTSTPNTKTLDRDSKTNNQSTYFFTTHVNVPLDALQMKSVSEKSCIDDGFSSPDYRDSENENKKKIEEDSEISLRKNNLLKVWDDSCKNIDEISNGAIGNMYAPIIQKQPKNWVRPAIEAEYSNDLLKMKVVDEPQISNTFIDNNNKKTSENCLINLVNPNKLSKSDNIIRLKYKHGKNKSLSKRKDRLAPLSEGETSSSEDESSSAIISKKNHKRNTKTKSHQKYNKAIRERGGSDKRHRNKAISRSKRDRTFRKTGEENESDEKQLTEKLSPSRKSDEGISTSHDNSADAYDIALDTGVALQRARRKCTVGKQNVLAEHWSSSESEDELSRNKGKKSAVAKKSSRSVRKVSSSRRSREDTIEEGVKSRVSASPDSVSKDVESDAERDPKDKREQEQHGWIVGRSHKKLVTMLVCSKSKSRPDVKDEDDEKEKLETIEEEKEDEKNEEKEDKEKNEKKDMDGVKDDEEKGEKEKDDEEDDKKMEMADVDDDEKENN